MNSANQEGTANLRPMRVVTSLALITFALLTACSPPAAAAKPRCSGRALPEFTGAARDWLNGKPRNLKQYRGKVLLVDVWTFACWNCYRSFPWLRKVEKQYRARGLRVVGIHTPEFKREKIRRNVERHLRKYRLTHPVMMDNDFTYWRKLRNRYWPTFYLVGKRGCIRGVFIGETHIGDPKSRRIEKQITGLLGERP